MDNPHGTPAWKVENGTLVNPGNGSELINDKKFGGFKLHLEFNCEPLAEDTADLALKLPAIPDAWQFLIDIIPAQLAGEHLAQISGVDCDSFRYCSYIVEAEYGLMNDNVAVPKEGS